MVLSLKVSDTKNNLQFCVHNHTSKSLMQLFMKCIPKGAVAATITGNQKYMGNLSTKVMEMLALGNDYDGLNISGWIKHSTIADSGVVQPPIGSKWDKPQQVDSGGLTYHLTKIAYASPPSDRMHGEYQFNAGSLV